LLRIVTQLVLPPSLAALFSSRAVMSSKHVRERASLSLMIALLLARSFAQVSCPFQFTSLYPSDNSGGTAWNDSFVMGNYACNLVSPNFMNFTVGDVTNQIDTLYHPTGAEAKHGSVVGSDPESIYLGTGEVITAVTVFVGTFQGNSHVVGGLTVFTNLTSTCCSYTVGSTSGQPQTMAGLSGRYVVYWFGSSGYILNAIGAATLPLS